MKYAYKYHCVQCNYLIAAANNPLDVEPDCLSCQIKHRNQMIERSKEKISVDSEFRAQKRIKKQNQVIKNRKERDRCKNAKN